MDRPLTTTSSTGSARRRRSRTAGTRPAGTSSVFVQPLDACSWQVTSYTTEEPLLFQSASGENASTQTTPRVMIITENVNKSIVTRGYFPMPLQATVTIIRNKAGCPLP